MTVQTEPKTEAIPKGLSWLRSTFADLREKIAGHEKWLFRLNDRVGKLEHELELSAKREEELRNQLAEADTQLDSGYSEVRANLRADYLSDLIQLADRSNALAVLLSHAVSKGSASAGPDALDRLGAPPAAVATVKAMAFGSRPRTISEPRFVSAPGGIRHSPEPSAADQYASAPHEPNRVQFLPAWKSAAEREAWEHQADIDNKPRTSSVQEHLTGVPAATYHRTNGDRSA